MLSKRVISAILGIIFLIIMVLWGSLPFFGLVIIAALIAIYEYNKILEMKSNNQLLLSVFTLFILMITFLNIKEAISFPWPFLILSILFLLALYHILKTDQQDFLSVFGYNIIGILYIAGGLSFFILLREFSIAPFDSTKALWLVLLATWAGDTGAYFIGNKFGKTSLSAKSPNKSVEGAIGGILFAMLVVSIYTTILGAFSSYWLLYALIIAVIAMIGDLFESSIKRFANVKDSANLIPGHGGILDRIDSLIFSAPFTYYFLFFILL
ncbi:MAG: phosphatidate cytidylyltransferase [Halanaerobiales bacterium]